MRYQFWRPKFAMNNFHQLTCAQLLWNFGCENSPVNSEFDSYSHSQEVWTGLNPTLTQCVYMSPDDIGIPCTNWKQVYQASVFRFLKVEWKLSVHWLKPNAPCRKISFRNFKLIASSWAFLKSRLKIQIEVPFDVRTTTVCKIPAAQQKGKGLKASSIDIDYNTEI